MCHDDFPPSHLFDRLRSSQKTRVLDTTFLKYQTGCAGENQPELHLRALDVTIVLLISSLSGGGVNTQMSLAAI